MVQPSAIEPYETAMTLVAYDWGIPRHNWEVDRRFEICGPWRPGNSGAPTPDVSLGADRGPGYAVIEEAFVVIARLRDYIRERASSGRALRMSDYLRYCADSGVGDQEALSVWRTLLESGQIAMSPDFKIVASNP